MRRKELKKERERGREEREINPHLEVTIHLQLHLYPVIDIHVMWCHVLTVSLTQSIA